PSLGHSDRSVRYAARVALEHQPVVQWKDRALAEPNPPTALAALIALARCGDKAVQPALVKALRRLKWDALTPEGRLDLLRVYELAFIRLGKPAAETRAAALAHLDRHYPANDARLNRELCQLLVYLE